MCTVCKDAQCHWGEYCYPSGRSVRFEYDDPHIGHDDAEVRCAGCKEILVRDWRGAIDHVCPSSGRSKLRVC